MSVTDIRIVNVNTSWFSFVIRLCKLKKKKKHCRDARNSGSSRQNSSGGPWVVSWTLAERAEQQTAIPGWERYALADGIVMKNKES